MLTQSEHLRRPPDKVGPSERAAHLGSAECMVGRRTLFP